MTTTLWNYMVVGLGGALGSMARFGFGNVASRLWGDQFPWGTLLVNVTGSFAIGLLAAWSGPEGRLGSSVAARQFLLVGICGGYTTFSSFSLQTLDLMREGIWIKAGVNVVASVILCLLAVWLGDRLGRSF